MVTRRWPQAFSQHVKFRRVPLKQAPPPCPPLVRLASLGLRDRSLSSTQQAILNMSLPNSYAKEDYITEDMLSASMLDDSKDPESKVALFKKFLAQNTMVPQMFSITHEHNHTVMMHEITSQTKQFLTDLVAQLSGAEYNVQHSIPSLSSFLPSFSIESAKEWSVIVGCISITYLVREYTTNPIYPTVLSIFQTMVSHYYAKKNRLVSVVSSFCMFANCTRSMEMQMNDDRLIKTAVTSLLAYVFGSQFTSSKKTGIIDTFMEVSSTFKKYTEGATYTVEWIMSVVSEFIAYISQQTGLFDWKVEASSNPDICEILVESSDLAKKFLEGASFNWDMSQAVFALKQKLELVYSKIPNNIQYNKDRDLLNRVAKEVNTWVATLKRNNVLNNGPRHEPLGILIAGGSGVGKSTGINRIMLEVTAKTIPESMVRSLSANWTDHVWPWNPENEYADGYHNQWNTFVDEVGALLPVKGSTTDGAMGIIRMINTVNTPMHMAELADKGSVNFSSKLVWGTTNANYFANEHLRCPLAFIRRWRVAVVQFVKPEYATEATKKLDIWKRVLDVEKVNPLVDEEGNAFLTVDHVEYIEWDFVKGEPKPGGKTYSYAGLVAKIVSEYDKLKYISTININQQKTLIDKVLLERFDTFEPAPKGFKEQMDCEPFDEVTECYTTSSEGSSDDDTSSWVDNNEDPLGEFSSQSNLNSIWTRSLPPLPLDSVKQFYCHVKSNYLNPIYTRVIEVSEAGQQSLLNQMSPMIVLGGLVAAAGLFWCTIKGKLNIQSGMTKPVKSATRASRSSKNFRLRNTVPRHEAMPQGCNISINTDELAIKLAKSNLWELRQVGSDRRYGFIMFYKNKTAIGPTHYLHKMEDILESNPEAKFVISNDLYGTHTFNLDTTDLLYGTGEDDEEDISYYRFHNLKFSMPDITNSIYNGSAIEGEKLYVTLLRKMKLGFRLHSACGVSIKDYKYGNYVGNIGYTYRIATKVGECGSPLLATDDKLQDVILGFHVAGDSACGISVVINKAHALTVYKLMDECDVNTLSVNNKDLISEAQMDASLPPQFTIGKEIRFVPNNGVSNVRKSPLYEAWGESKCAPAMLYEKEIDGIVIDPYYKARNNYCKNEAICEENILEASVNMYSSEILDCVDPEDVEAPRVLSFEEACKGIPGIFKGIPRGTSAGYPLCLDYTKKYDFFGSEGEYEFDSSACIRLKREVFDMIEGMKNGVRPHVHYVDFLKDERRTIEKAYSGSSRLVSASPLAHLIIMRMYFGHFSIFMTKKGNRIHNGIAIGINPYSMEWDELYRKLNQRPIKFAGDYAKFDGSETVQVLKAAGKVAEKYYYNSCEQDREVRKVLLMDVYNSVHTCTLGGRTYEYCWNGSMPSGCFLTGLFNSIVNNLIVRYCALRLLCLKLRSDYTMNEVAVATKLLKGNLYMIVFGDDNVVSITEDLNIKPSEIAYQLSLIGMKYTNADKTEMSDEPGIISFLKRTFRKQDDRYVGPLDLDVILESPYWTKKGTSIESQQLDIDTTFRELSLHGVEVFNKYSQVIISRVRERFHYYSPYSTYDMAFAAAISMEAEEL